MDSLRYAVRDHRLIPAGSVGLVAVSGGADSMALLHLFVQHQRAHPGHYTLYAATLDHGLRGAESAADAAFVEETCAAWGVPCLHGKTDLDPSAPGVEGRARTARYAFLAQSARQVGASWVATAHHADDQAETVLMRVIRGTGVRGLAAMRPRSLLPDAPDLTLIRPLLGVRRTDLLAYCAQQNISFRHDPTNDDPTYRRNWVRAIAIPILAQANPALSGALTRLAEAAQTDDDLLSAVVQPFIDTISIRNGRAHLPRAGLSALHPALRVRAIAWACGQLAIDEPPTFDHLRAAAALSDGTTGGAVELAGGLYARLDHDALVIGRSETAPDYPPAPWLPTEAVIIVSSQWTPLTSGQSARWADFPGAGVVDFYADDGQIITLRTLRPGERIRPVGLSGHSTCPPALARSSSPAHGR
ncbi:MAG: tRNA lysidine(34) synthetase TilS [Anaerolineae bacterium]|nr:tRNA lysidine(34) synthetase TilS [Anaerolineae bacterium]